MFACVVFSGLLIFNDLLLASKEGLFYYGGSALFDLATIVIISRNASRMALSLQKICIASIGLNFFGWIMWMLYMPPVMYDSLFIALYVCALFTLIKRNKTDVGEFAMDRWSTSLRLYSPSWAVNNTQDRRKER